MHPDDRPLAAFILASAFVFWLATEAIIAPW